MAWPNPQDYNEAVQVPELAFEDPELQAGEVELTPLGLPKVASGNFASVYRFDCGGSSYAVKCFLRDVRDQHRTYTQLSQFAMSTSVRHMVDFKYQQKGIEVEGNWYPIVKMKWVDGLGLDHFIRKNWSNRSEIERVIAQFATLVEELQSLGAAHCDLQHGNVLVKKDGIRLVDYDGMYVPAMKGEPARELGHANYQHPGRTERHFDPRLDSFSAWIIYYSLFFLRLDSSMWQRFQGGDDCLLFRKSDFQDPERSRLLNEIKGHQIPDIKAQYDPLMRILGTSIDDVPRFALGGQEATGSFKIMSVKTAAVKPAPRYPPNWPKIDHYFKAALRPKQAYTDEKLARTIPVPTFGVTSSQVEADATTAERLTIEKTVIKGRNGMVLHLVGEAGTRHYAVKFFHKDLADRHLRYDAIHRHKKTNSNRYFTPFIYLPHGIRVGPVQLPVLKMLWINGDNLEDYVLKQLSLGFSEAIEDLARKFVNMITALHSDGIAHGDLEPGNIIVEPNGNLKIVDYDAMYVPALASLESCELGRRGYQHPNRKLTNYGNYMDRYSALVIYGMLICLSRNPPQKYWKWETLLNHLRNQPPQLRQEKSHWQKKGGSSFADRLPKQMSDRGLAPTVMGTPVFEKASHEDFKETKNFANSLQKLTKVLHEQQKRRIDQVATLDSNMWNLF